MHSETPTSPPFGSTSTTKAGPRFGARLLGALSYLGPACLIPIVMNHKNAWVRWHAGQGFVVFFLECIALGLAIVVDATVGRIPWVGLVVMLILRVGLIVGFVMLSAVGAVKALAGEHSELPLVGRYAKQIPGIGPPRV